MELKETVKKLALDMGAKLVGVGSRERLKNAPPSADLDYCLPGTRSCIVFAYPNSIEALENYFSKKERMSIKKEQYFAYTTAWKTALKIAEVIEENSEYKAFPLSPNGRYRKKGGATNVLLSDTQYPDFSLRYGAVAAGLGHLGWSGNLVTKEYGGSLYLGGVLTTAPFEPDPIAEENNCNQCKICVKVCTTGYFSIDEEEAPVIIGGSKEVYAKRGVYARCAIGCAGWTGLSEDGNWSTWTPDHVSLKNLPEKEFTNEYKQNLMRELLSGKKTPLTHRKFNIKIMNSFARGFVRTENVGLRNLKDTNPRCAGCNLICVADPEKRAELFKMLKNSGKVYIDEDGREFVKKIGENGKEIIHYPITEEEYFKI